MSAKYWIAQVVEDLFRKEPRNVGVFVSLDGAFAAKFLGEADHGQIDGRKLRMLSHPDVYRQWIGYWRREMQGAADMSSIMESTHSHYRVVPGGDVTDTGDGVADDVARYLYSLLVSEGGFPEAIGGEADDATVALEADLSNEFRARNIIGEQTPQIQHPIRRGQTFLGSHNLIHRPAFVQENGQLWVMESVDFTIRQKRRSKDHAGLSAYMFKDLRQTRRNVEPVSVVKFSEAEADSQDVEYGLQLLRNESRVVNWLDESERTNFIEERVQIATS
jgi:hypothetical protein